MIRFDEQVWRALSPLLDRALDVDVGARAVLLADLWREHPDLAAIIGALPAEHDRLAESDFLETSPLIGRTAAPSLAGQTIGPYTLDVPLGMGGMGTVWRARRSD